MKVIFLDIDGVLNSNRSAAALGGMPWPGKKNERDWHFFDPVAIGLLQRACKETGAVCVLSSSWRNLMSLTDIQELAQHLGVSIVDRTKPSAGDEPRGQQIQEWLLRHPHVVKWAIIDDDGDMLDCQIPNFVRTTFTEGMLFAHYMELTKILGIEQGPSHQKGVMQ